MAACEDGTFLPALTLLPRADAAMSDLSVIILLPDNTITPRRSARDGQVMLEVVFSRTDMRLVK